MRKYFSNLWQALLGREVYPFPADELVQRIVSVIGGEVKGSDPNLLLSAKPPLTMTSWKCWVEDGTEYNSQKHKVIDLPERGMQAVMVERSDGTRVFLRRAKYYIWEGGTVVATMNPTKPARNVKEGTWVDNKTFKEIMQKTM